jgi:hypothetical protein
MLHRKKKNEKSYSLTKKKKKILSKITSKQFQQKTSFSQRRIARSKNKKNLLNNFLNNLPKKKMFFSALWTDNEVS